MRARKNAMRMLQRMTLTVMALAPLGLLGGCQAGQVKEENAALAEQNDRLHQELHKAQAALDAAEMEKAQLRNKLEQAKQAKAAPAPAPTPEPKAAKGEPKAEPMPAPMATGFDNIEGIETLQEPGQVTVRVPGDVLFDSGKITLRDSAQQTLDQIAEVISDEYPGKMVRVEGYTDTDPIKESPWVDNLQLSAERAAAVHRYLQDHGVSAERMYAAGFGPWHPRDTKEKSRRVQIVVVMEQQDPMMSYNK